jgi:ketosteroid isomerase-like protein
VDARAKPSSSMKRCILCAVLGLVLAAEARAQQPASATMMAKQFIDAYNDRNLAYFEKMLAPDAVVPDDDGHILTDRPHMIDLFRMRFALEPPAKMTASNIVTREAGNSMLASFAYTYERVGAPTKGLITIVYKKARNDWQIALIHYSINLPPQRGRI